MSVVADTPLARRVAELLERARMSGREASVAAGQTPDFVRNLLSGRSKAPSVERLRALARALEVPETALLRPETPLPSAAAHRRIAPLPDDIPIPEVGMSVQADGGLAVYERGAWRVPGARLFGRADPASCVVIEAGAGLPPDVTPGDLLLIDRGQTALAGGLYMVREGQGLAVARLTPALSGGRVRVERRGTTDEVDAAEVQVVGRVVARWSWV
jgi:transcriptional regulator with XRE-family HTH domain